jgi:hypothetical protein
MENRMQDLSPELQHLLRMGQEGNRSIVSPREQKIRALKRKWRNLVGEAKFDLPTCLHEYINWTIPANWEMYSTINNHDFLIKIPNFETISVTYRVMGISDWQFARFELLIPGQTAISTNYNDLPFFLSMAYRIKKPVKTKVVIEEIEGGLAENVKLIQVSDVPRFRAMSEEEMWAGYCG